MELLIKQVQLLMDLMIKLIDNHKMFLQYLHK